MPPKSPTTRYIPHSLSHFVIFNPTIKPPPEEIAQETVLEDEGKDLRDDLREAAQIVFYTSREAGGVSRDVMLRQVGLAKGLMGFADMVGNERPEFYAVQSHKSRLIIFSPEPDFFIYVSITLAHTVTLPDSTPGASSSIQSSPKPVEEVVTAPYLSDRMLVEALRRGYEDFRFLHSPLSHLLPPTPATSSLLDRYWTRFAFSFESVHLTSPDPLTELTTWLNGYSPVPANIAVEASTALETYQDEVGSDEITSLGVLTPDGPLACKGEVDDALYRFLLSLLRATLPPPIAIAENKSERSSLGFGLRRKKGEDRKSSWSTFTSATVSWVPGLNSASAPETPRPDSPSRPLIPPSSAVKSSKSPGGSKTSSITSKAENEKKKGGWSLGLPGLGSLSGLGEAVGLSSMGAALGLAGRSELPDDIGGIPSPVTDLPRETPTTIVSTTSLASEIALTAPEVKVIDSESTLPSEGTESMQTENMGKDKEETTGRPSLEMTRVALSDLTEAVETHNEEISWEGKSVWVCRSDNEEWVRRRLIWVIRDNILLYLLSESALLAPQPPSSQPTLKLYTTLAAILKPLAKTDKIMSTTSANSSILHKSSGITEINGPTIDPLSAGVLNDLKDDLQEDGEITEIYAKTSQSNFVLAKRSRKSDFTMKSPTPSMRVSRPSSVITSSKAPSFLDSESQVQGGADKEDEEIERGELYMLLGRADASLTDAEHAVRAFARTHPEFAS